MSGSKDSASRKVLPRSDSIFLLLSLETVKGGMMIASYVFRTTANPRSIQRFAYCVSMVALSVNAPPRMIDRVACSPTIHFELLSPRRLDFNYDFDHVVIFSSCMR